MLWNPKFLYRISVTSPAFLVLSQINPVRRLPSCFSSNSCHNVFPFSSVFAVVIAVKFFYRTYLYFSLRCIRHPQHIPEFGTLIIFGEVCHLISKFLPSSFRLLSYKFKYLLQPAVLTARSQYLLLYEGHLESKERFANKKFLLLIGKKKNMQVLPHTFTYFSTWSPWTLRHLSYRDTSLLIPSSYQTAAWLFNQSMTACCRSSSSACRLPARCSFIFKKR